MRAARLLNLRILVEHVTQDGPPDDMGDPTEESTWSTYRGYVWQETVSEDTAGGTVEREVWRLALERSAAGNVDAGDRIIVGGELDESGEPIPELGDGYDLAGEPWAATNPRTRRIEYVYAKLERSA